MACLHFLLCNYKSFWLDGVCCLLSLQVWKGKKRNQNGRHGDISQFEEENIKLQVSIGKWKLIVRSFRLSDHVRLGTPSDRIRAESLLLEGWRRFQDFRVWCSGNKQMTKRVGSKQFEVLCVPFLSFGDFGRNGVGWLETLNQSLSSDVQCFQHLPRKNENCIYGIKYTQWI